MERFSAHQRSINCNELPISTTMVETLPAKTVSTLAMRNGINLARFQLGIDRVIAAPDTSCSFYLSAVTRTVGTNWLRHIRMVADAAGENEFRFAAFLLRAPSSHPKRRVPAGAFKPERMR